MQKGFTKNKEDFTCERCGLFIEGTGYTNHCHACFYSKHVDKAPGDRLEECSGMMRPIEVTGSVHNLVIRHACELCGFERNNKVQQGDDMAKLAELITRLNSQR